MASDRARCSEEKIENRKWEERAQAEAYATGKKGEWREKMLLAGLAASAARENVSENRGRRS